MESTVADLRSGSISVEDIPVITVVKSHGNLLTLSNRRLYAFRAALPIDAEVPMRLLLGYVLPDCKYYHSVRIMKSAPSLPPVHGLDSLPSIGRLSSSVLFSAPEPEPGMVRFHSCKEPQLKYGAEVPKSLEHGICISSSGFLQQRRGPHIRCSSKGDSQEVPGKPDCVEEDFGPPLRTSSLSGGSLESVTNNSHCDDFVLSAVVMPETLRERPQLLRHQSLPDFKAEPQAREAELVLRQSWDERLKKLLRTEDTILDDSWRTFRKKACEKYINESPSKVLFTKPCINDRFSCGRTLDSTVAGLKSGSIAIEDIPMITVVERHGRLLTLDHRRLYAFRAALPSDAKVPMRLLQSEWAVDRALLPDSQYYHAVRVETSSPSLPSQWIHSLPSKAFLRNP